MKATGLQVTKISVGEMLNREEKSYNSQVWKGRVTDMTKYDKLQFYVIEADGKVYRYARFFASYVADGIYFFTDWSAYSAGLTNAGFCKVYIEPDGTVLKDLFKAGDKEGYAENNRTNRQIFRDRLTPIGVMVSNSI